MQSKYKTWVTIKIKKKYSRFGISEMVGIYYNPYNRMIKEVIKDWIIPECINQVYGFKHN